MFGYDPEILAAVQATAHSIDDVLTTMRRIDSVCVDGDGLKWFNHLYLEVTEAVAAGVSTGNFQDPAWMSELDVQFAGLYFAALRSAFSGAAAPGCWRAVLDRRDQVGVTRIQFALAGVNAHINHDLPIALIRTGGAPVHGSAHYLDYSAVNATLQALIDRAKVELRVRLLGDVLPPVSPLENTLAAFSMVAAREAAWNNAEVLWSLQGMPAIQDRTLDTLDGMTAVIGKTLLVPIA